LEDLSLTNQPPLVSVIVPAYNHERYVQETILSIINQTYKNIELIIIDDGSSDNTWGKIIDLQNICKDRFSRIDFSKQDNAGTCITLNRLIEKSSGEYIYLIASDDKAAPEAIEKELFFLLENQEYALVVGANDIIDTNGRQCFWDKNRNNVYKKKDARWLSFSEWFMEFRHQIDFFSDDFGSYYSLLRYENHIPNGF
jgi:alpha-1,3-rhamnosyltransferase